jgi:hypothetical protein
MKSRRAILSRAVTAATLRCPLIEMAAAKAAQGSATDQLTQLDDAISHARLLLGALQDVRTTLGCDIPGAAG